MTVIFSSEHRDSVPTYPDTQIYNKRDNYQIASYLFLPTAWVFLAQKKNKIIQRYLYLQTFAILQHRQTLFELDLHNDDKNPTEHWLTK